MKKKFLVYGSGPHLLSINKVNKVNAGCFETGSGANNNVTLATTNLLCSTGTVASGTVPNDYYCSAGGGDTTGTYYGCENGANVGTGVPIIYYSYGFPQSCSGGHLPL